MGKKKRAAVPETDPLREALAAAAAQTVQPGDLAGFGQIQVFLETALTHVPGRPTCPPHLAEMLDGLITLLEKSLLDEIPDPAGAQAFVLAALPKLDAAVALEDADAAGEALAPLLRELPAFGGPAPETRAAASADRTAFETVNVGGDEDAVIYAEFIAESQEHLETIEAQALEMESGGFDIDLINNMFRCFHSMKGAAGFLGLTAINGLCHEVETLLDRARKLTLRVDGQVIEVLLAAIDMGKRLLATLGARLEAGPGVTLEPVDVAPVKEAVRLILDRPPARPSAVDPDETQPDPGRLGGVLLAEGAVSQEALAQALQRQKRPLGEVLIEMGATTPEQVQGGLAKQSALGRTRSSAIKVDTMRLDALLEMVGELVIAQSLVAQDEALGREGNHTLYRNVANLSKITRNLQEHVMDMRMVPLRQTFQKMLRLVRDTAIKTGKEARLTITGEETEIDKTIIDEIADPLIHLMRNAVDHGLEPPDEREAAGKPREGEVLLNAFHQGGNVVIEVRDDGRGMDPARLLAKARERGLIREEATPDEAEIFDLLFLPGFSTAEKTSDISGRGVGMDVVRRNIENLGGRVEVRSRLGEGSTFLVRLPLTMAIIDGMIVRVGEQRFVLPTLGIEESIRPRPESLSTVARRGEMLMVRGDLVPLLRLSELFDVEDGEEDALRSLAIVVNADGRRCGLLVDELLGQQQVVIKSLSQRLQGIRGVSGGCILGDGRVGLILDIEGLVRLSEKA